MKVEKNPVEYTLDTLLVYEDRKPTTFVVGRFQFDTVPAVLYLPIFYTHRHTHAHTHIDTHIHTHTHTPVP